MLEDGGSLREGVVRGDAPVGPDFQQEAVVIGALADAGIFNGVADAGDRGEEGVDGNDADGLVGFLVFVARAEAAADFDFEFHFELFLLVESADVLLGVDQFEVLVQSDVARQNGSLLVDGEEKGLGIARMGAEKDFFEVQDDVGDVLANALDAGELMHGAIDFDGGDGGAFEGGEQDAAEGVADGVAVTGFKGFGDELGIGFSGGGVLFGQPLGHFESS